MKPCPYSFSKWQKVMPYVSPLSKAVFSPVDLYTAQATVYDKLSWKKIRAIPLSGVTQRNDFLHEMNLGAKWTPINRLTLNLGYQYSTRSSTDNTLNFSDHMVVTRIGYKF